MKKCSKCGIEKEFYDFAKGRAQCKICRKEYKKQYRQNNLLVIKEYEAKYDQDHRKERSQYYQDHKEEKKQYQQDHKEEIKERRANFYQNNKEIILANNKQYRQNNKEKLKEKQQQRAAKPEAKEKRNLIAKNKRQNDIFFRLRQNVSSQIYKALKKNGSSKNGDSCFNYLPYTIEELWTHLESQFETWMTRENNSIYDPETWDDNDDTTKTWQLDHIIPQSKLPFTSMEDDNFKKCWELKNLRPLSAKQNISDGDRR